MSLPSVLPEARVLDGGHLWGGSNRFFLKETRGSHEGSRKLELYKPMRGKKCSSEIS